MSESEPRRPRFRLQTLVLVVVILGLSGGLVVQGLQLAEARAEAEKQRMIAAELRAVAKVIRDRIPIMKALNEQKRQGRIRAAKKAEAAAKPSVLHFDAD